MNKICTDELVAAAWLKSASGLAGIDVGLSPVLLLAKWATGAFIHVSAAPLGLPPNPNYPIHNPRIIVHCWAAPKDFETAAITAQLVRAATYATDSARNVSMPVRGYNDATVIAVQTVAEPTRVDGPDPDSLARYDIPILMEWY